LEKSTHATKYGTGGFGDGFIILYRAFQPSIFLLYNNTFIFKFWFLKLLKYIGILKRMTIILSNAYTFLNVTYRGVPCNKLLKKKKIKPLLLL